MHEAVLIIVILSNILELPTKEKNLESERMTGIRLKSSNGYARSPLGLVVTGAWKGTNQDKLNEELGWEPVYLRQW